MSPESKKFLEDHRPKYDAFIMACSISAALQAMGEDFDYDQGKRILQEIRPGTEVDITNPSVKVFLVKDLYTAYDRLYRTA